MDRAERRRRNKNIIKKRKKLLKELNKNDYWNLFDDDILCEGELRNNNMMNKYGGHQGHKKTNTRKACSSYRHHGGYGKANNYKPHDLRQIERENDYIIGE